MRAFFLFFKKLIDLSLLHKTKNGKKKIYEK